MGQRLMRSKWEYWDSNHSIGWMRKGDNLTLDFVVLKLFKLTLLPSTMWPEHGLPYNWGLISLIITSHGGWQKSPTINYKIKEMEIHSHKGIHMSTLLLRRPPNEFPDPQNTFSIIHAGNSDPASDIKVQRGWEN